MNLSVVTLLKEKFILVEKCLLWLVAYKSIYFWTLNHFQFSAFSWYISAVTAEKPDFSYVPCHIHLPSELIWRLTFLLPLYLTLYLFSYCPARQTDGHDCKLLAVLLQCALWWRTDERTRVLRHQSSWQGNGWKQAEKKVASQHW